MEESRPPGSGPAGSPSGRTTISPVRYGFRWSWYPHFPGLSKARLHSVPGWMGFLGSNSGYSSCVGWSSEAGQWASPPTFSNTTVRPASTSTDLGSNPSSVTCTTTLPPLSSWANASPTKVNAAAHKRTTSRIPTRRSAPPGTWFAMGEGYEIRALLTKTRGRDNSPAPPSLSYAFLSYAFLSYAFLSYAFQALSAPWRSPCGS